jgi:DNA-binding response OmpR family regulator
VVVYEPNAPARRALSRLLQDEGWATLECAQTSEVLEAARSGRTIDALLVDFRSGVAVADEVRLTQPSVRVLFMSSHDELPRGIEGTFVRRPIDFRLVESLLQATPRSRRNTG